MESRMVSPVAQLARPEDDNDDDCLVQADHLGHFKFFKWYYDELIEQCYCVAASHFELAMAGR